METEILMLPNIISQKKSIIPPHLSKNSNYVILVYFKFELVNSLYILLILISLSNYPLYKKSEVVFINFYILLASMNPPFCSIKSRN